MGKRPILVLLVVASTIWTLAGIAGVLAVMFVPLLFDPPGSTSNPPTLALAASVLLFPLACVASIVGSWLAYRRERLRGVLLFAALPVLPIATAVLASIAHELIYGGGIGG
jgi:hypothetical protein